MRLPDEICQSPNNLCPQKYTEPANSEKKNPQVLLKICFLTPEKDCSAEF